ncbi:MAG TPA: hypothetical protein VF614_04055 [Chthoniobacteraceae bacterium]
MRRTPPPGHAAAYRLDIRNISRTARAIAHDEPGFADNFLALENRGQATLLTTEVAEGNSGDWLGGRAADAYLVQLAKPGVAAKFIANELPADFVQDLTDDRSATDAAKDEIESGDIGGVQSTAEAAEGNREAGGWASSTSAASSKPA